MARIDDPMFPFARSIIDATKDLVCAYSIDLAYYLSEAAAGMIALERITRYIPDNVPIIFDAKFGELGDSADRSAHGAFEAFQADAVTFGSMPSQTTIEAFLKFEGKTIFLPSDNLDETLTIYKMRSNGGVGVRVEVNQLSDLSNILSRSSTASSRSIDSDARVTRAASIANEAGIPIIISAHVSLSPQAAQTIKNFSKSHPLSMVDVGSPVLYESRLEDYAEVVRARIDAMKNMVSHLEA